jgi:hypothetical protein
MFLSYVCHALGAVLVLAVPN